ncbi:MAG: hypothetical protein EGP87_05765 [Paraprevotella clara]|nr:hypothetical protein [Paraprevotella clara]
MSCNAKPMFSIVLVIIYYVILFFCVCFMLLPAKLRKFLVGWKNKCRKIFLKNAISVFGLYGGFSGVSDNFV